MISRKHVLPRHSASRLASTFGGLLLSGLVFSQAGCGDDKSGDPTAELDGSVDLPGDARVVGDGAVRSDGAANDGGDTDSSQPTDAGSDPGDAYVGPRGNDGIALYPAGERHSPITESVAKNMRAILANDATKNRKNFIRLGDNASYAGKLLGCFDANSEKGYKLGATASAKPSVDYFNGGDIGGKTPFAYTVDLENMTPWGVLEVSGGKTFVQKQIDAGKPSFALVSFGPIVHAGQGDPNQDDYLIVGNVGPNVLKIVDTLIQQGVVPLVRSVHPYFNAKYPGFNKLVPLANALTRAVAQGRQVPYADAYLDLLSLGEQGWDSNGAHLATSPMGACDLTEAGFVYGDNRVNRIALEQLDRVRRVAIDSAAAPEADAPALDGDGTAESPVVAHALPFTDMRAVTMGGKVADYSGCGGAKTASASETVYRFDVQAPTRLRAFVFDRMGSGIDTSVHHFVGDLKSCVSSHHALLELELAAGTHYFVVDGAKGSGADPTSEFAFGLVACMNDDVTCKTDVR